MFYSEFAWTPEESAQRQIEEEKTKLSLELAEKHKIQLQIISTKSREQMNLNFSALEDKVKIYFFLEWNRS